MGRAHATGIRGCQTVMTPLQRNALATVPLSMEEVEFYYEGARGGIATTCLRALCESHELLRAELQGAELLIRDYQRKSLYSEMALALTDTGSQEFREIFPGHMPECGMEISGWRVVEKIREVLLG